MELWHRSIVSEPIGSHLLPMAYWYGNALTASFIYFHEAREGAMKWSNSALCGYSLYRVASSLLTGLEPHPQTPQIWRTKDPVPFSVLEVVERRDNPTTLPGLPEMVRQRAANYPGIVTV